MMWWLLAIAIIGLGAVAHFIEFMVTSYEERRRAGIWCAVLIGIDWYLIDWFLTSLEKRL